MSRLPLALALAVAFTSAPAAAQSGNRAGARIPVLVLTGENDTDWRWTSTRLRQALADSGKFEVTVSLFPDGDLSDRAYLDRFELLIVDYAGQRWGDVAQKNFLESVSEGMGLVAFGRATAAFPEWEEYGQTIGLRSDGALGYAVETFAVELEAEHPITAGLPRWAEHTEAPPPAVEVSGEGRAVLARAGDAPVAVVGQSGQGRVVATALGAVLPSREDSWASGGGEHLEQFLIRASEWAATGAVTPLRRLEPNTLTAADRAAGWRLLFDGESVAGWKALDGRALGERLTVANGCIQVPAGGLDFLHEERFDRFELEAEWRVAEGTKLASDAARSSLFADAENYGEPILRPAGEFNHGRVVVADGQVEHFLNGVRLLSLYLSPAEWVTRVTDDPRDDPVLGSLPLCQLTLQHPDMAVWIRNVKIREVPLAPEPAAAGPRVIELFDGSTTEGWSWVPQATGSRAPGAFQVEDGELVCEGLPVGYLRTNGEHDDFVLELDYLIPRTTTNRTAAGILLRGSGDDFWPRSLEVKLDDGYAGDLWARDLFPMTLERRRTRGNNVLERLRDMERGHDEWNRLEVRVEGDAITVRLNGEVVNATTGLDATPGWIGIAAQGANFRYRGLRLTPLR